MKIIYISTRYPRPIEKRISRNIIFSDSASAHVFSDAIFHGLVDNNCPFYNINIPPIGHYPKMARVVFNKPSRIVENGVEVYNVGFCNIKLYQYYSIYKNVYSSFKKILGNESVVFLIYSLNSPAIKAALRYKREIAPNTKLILIIPDFVEDMYADHTFKNRLLKGILGNMDGIYKKIDGFVYLTERMKERTKSDKPYRVIEAIYDDKNESIEQPVFNDKLKVVFYSGKLNEKFGVRNLVDAFCLIKDESYRLILCGSGDSESYIKRMAEKDARIIFYGQIPRNEVLRIQKEATLLVNPRLPIDDFTKYSFPSKDVQYMASGIPTLLYELEGIPVEYYDYCFHLPKNQISLNNLKNEIMRICSLSSDERKVIGEKARTFILKNKNARVQCNKIWDLIESLI